MTQLETDLQSLLAALQTLSQAALASGDMSSNSTILAAMSQVSAALSLAGAQDIVSTLPNDADGNNIKSMLQQMANAVKKINAQQKNLNEAISIATNFTLLVTQASAGQWLAGVQTVQHLAGLLS